MFNPPAFPNESVNCSPEHADGMTLRDYFAAKAMQTLIHSMTKRASKLVPSAGADLFDRETPMSAVIAYRFADMMLRERAK